MLKDLQLWITIIIFIGIFIASSYFAQIYHDELGSYLQEAGALEGAFVYIVMVILSTVIAPLTTLPLLAVFSNTWGSLFAGSITIIGETLGALLAFYIARKYGRPVASRLASEQNLRKIRDIIPEKPEHAFFTVVFLRIAIPADILSYALGLFSNIKTTTYLLATIVGVTPAAMFFAYTGTLPIRYQIIVILTGLIVMIYMLKYWIKHFDRQKNS